MSETILNYPVHQHKSPLVWLDPIAGYVGNNSVSGRGKLNDCFSRARIVSDVKKLFAAFLRNRANYGFHPSKVFTAADFAQTVCTLGEHRLKTAFPDGLFVDGQFEQMSA
jgi:hypothetical protein